MTTKASPVDRTGLAASAKGALERVCSGAGLDPASRYYAPSFLDHVNDLEFHGVAGTEASLNLYEKVLSDTAITVEEQIIEGNRVASRFVVTGTSYGRRVRFNGITISRFEDGMIVEDWSVTDTLGMLRQLGPWRSIVMALKSFGSLTSARSATSAGSHAQNPSACART